MSGLATYSMVWLPSGPRSSRRPPPRGSGPAAGTPCSSRRDPSSCPIARAPRRDRLSGDSCDEPGVELAERPPAPVGHLAVGEGERPVDAGQVRPRPARAPGRPRSAPEVRGAGATTGLLGQLARRGIAQDSPASTRRRRRCPSGRPDVLPVRALVDHQRHRAFDDRDEHRAVQQVRRPARRAGRRADHHCRRRRRGRPARPRDRPRSGQLAGPGEPVGPRRRPSTSARSCMTWRGRFMPSTPTTRPSRP